MADADALRASDEDRDRAAEALRAHYAAGRLTEEDLDERVEAVYAAKTDADLAALQRDLPAVPASPQQQRVEHVERRAELRGRVLQQSGAALAPFLVCCVIWVVAGASGYFWPAWVALAVVLPLARNGWALYGPGADLDQVERHLERHDHPHGRYAARAERREDRHRRRHGGH